MQLDSLVQKTQKVIRRVTQRSNSSFKFAFLFLGPQQREALKDIYQFCRIVDDIVDERPSGDAGEALARSGLAHWREEVARLYDANVGIDQLHEPLTRRLREQLARFAYPRHAFEEIIAGCEMDLVQSRYATQAELELYCYRVASCVGFLCLPIFGNASPKACEYGHHLGLALQYTNILRDVGEDAARGRIYLPQDLLQRHGLHDADILASKYDRRFVDAATEFAALAQAHFDLATARLHDVTDRRALLAAEVMGQTYHAVLVELRAMNYNVFVRRPGLRRRDKILALALAIAKVELPQQPAQAALAILSRRQVPPSSRNSR